MGPDHNYNTPADETAWEGIDLAVGPRSRDGGAGERRPTSGPFGCYPCEEWGRCDVHKEDK